jgi:hypothetical protein
MAIAGSDSAPANLFRVNQNIRNDGARSSIQLKLLLTGGFDLTKFK